MNGVKKKKKTKTNHTCICARDEDTSACDRVSRILQEDKHADQTRNSTKVD